MAKQQVGLKLEPEMVKRLDARAKAEGITRTEAVEQAVTRWLDGPEASAVLDALPKAPTPARADLKRKPAKVVEVSPLRGPIKEPPRYVMGQTKTPPPVRARVHVEVGGPVRPVPGSRLKKR